MQELQREVICPKWTKVLLIVLGFSLIIALGGLCALAILYNNTSADFESVNEKHFVVSMQLSAQVKNSTIIKQELNNLTARHNILRESLSFYNVIKQELNNLTARYNILRESLSFYDVIKQELSNLTARYNILRESLSFYDVIKEELNDLTARYNILRELLSFYDAQSCNLPVDDWIACRGKLYLFNSDKLDWLSSRNVCISKGADLVTITNQTEQDFLVSKVKETHWIGLNDLETEGHWVWVNNQTLNETGVQFWFSEGQREPDNWKNQDPSGENCASLGDENGNLQSWFDASCKKARKFICEININLPKLYL